MTTKHPDCHQIIAELNKNIAAIAWHNDQQFNYRHFNLCAGIGAESFLSSIQQYHFMDGKVPAFFVGKRPFFQQIQQLPPNRTFVIYHDDRWTTLQIFNFYPSLLRKAAQMLDKQLFINVYLRHHSAAIEQIKINTPQRIRWGYELLNKPSGPDIFLSGPGRFQFNVQLFQVDYETDILTLYFIASKRPSSLFKIFGRARIFPYIKQLANSHSPLPHWQIASSTLRNLLCSVFTIASTKN